MHTMELQPIETVAPASRQFGIGNSVGKIWAMVEAPVNESKIRLHAAASFNRICGSATDNFTWWLAPNLSSFF